MEARRFPKSNGNYTSAKEETPSWIAPKDHDKLRCGAVETIIIKIIFIIIE